MNESVIIVILNAIIVFTSCYYNDDVGKCHYHNYSYLHNNKISLPYTINITFKYQ